ncbi:hypothetical protein [Morganella morganii]|uniref:hypothetical protein n=1 Tax=Morganella morganii TaxID=582 RepID=UPI00311A27EA
MTLLISLILFYIAILLMLRLDNRADSVDIRIHEINHAMSANSYYNTPVVTSTSMKRGELSKIYFKALVSRSIIYVIFNVIIDFYKLLVLFIFNTLPKILFISLLVSVVIEPNILKEINIDNTIQFINILKTNFSSIIDFVLSVLALCLLTMYIYDVKQSPLRHLSGYYNELLCKYFDEDPDIKVVSVVKRGKIKKL